jgi:methionyl-tRNA formyltransferase
MNAKLVVLLMPKKNASSFKRNTKNSCIKIKTIWVDSLDSLIKAFSKQIDLLISFGTSVVVPRAILMQPSLTAINIHAASPRYPGRDPHHFAIYDKVKKYGATLHYMTNNVDAGPIVDVEVFSVCKGTTPSELLELANRAGWKLIRRFLRSYALHGPPEPISGIRWGKKKSTRKKFLELCRVTPSMSAKEIHHRHNATTMPGYRNLYVEFAGLQFRIDEKSS